MIGKGDKVAQAIKNVKKIDGYTDVIVHGSKDGFFILHNGEYIKIDHRTLANFIKRSGEYNGGAIRLLSCDSGKGIAQDLANKLNTKVMAPSNKVWINAKTGKITIGPKPIKNTGVWIEYTPRKRIK